MIENIRQENIYFPILAIRERAVHYDCQYMHTATQVFQTLSENIQIMLPNNFLTMHAHSIVKKYIQHNICLMYICTTYIHYIYNTYNITTITLVSMETCLQP